PLDGINGHQGSRPSIGGYIYSTLAVESGTQPPPIHQNGRGATSDAVTF
ncbi:hypothetical protein A2U01_0036121, partial [Trifolium medium]|nr:hypothetical protein [Trifolium medium]